MEGESENLKDAEKQMWKKTKEDETEEKTEKEEKQENEPKKNTGVGEG